MLPDSKIRAFVFAVDQALLMVFSDVGFDALVAFVVVIFMLSMSWWVLEGKAENE